MGKPQCGGHGVPGTFMLADMDELVHVHFHGEMVDKLPKIDHDLYSLVLLKRKGSV